MDIKELHRQGLSLRQIAKRTGRSRNTVARILDQRAPTAYQVRAARSSKLDAYKPFLRQRWEAYGLSATRLLEEIQAQGYSGSLNLVQRFLKTLKEQTRVDSAATVRFETAPGEQAQVDWAFIQEIEGKKAYAFVLVLSFSRMTYVELTHSSALPDLIRCHQNAFAFLGGVPASILYDNMAQVRLPHSKALNPLMADFAAHYGFSVKTHRPYRPRTKGKVERAVGYVETDFLAGRDFDTLAEANGHASSWTNKANQRIHGTTRQRPVDLFAREKPKLAPIGAVAPYVLAQRYERQVDMEGFVQVARTRYSVPPEHVGRQVAVIVGEYHVTIRCCSNQTIIATHRLADRPGACVADPEHVAALWRRTVSTLPAVAAVEAGPQKETTSPTYASPAVPETRPEVRPLSFYEEFAQ